MGQLLLIPDPRPLEERLGEGFFHDVPKRAGVYLMREAADKVLYVGKAKNLRQRLQSYRIANPDRMPRRHLRMLRQVARIEFEFCPGESAALERESELLRSLKPRFNRAGVWPGKTTFLVWRRVKPQSLVTHLRTQPEGEPASDERFRWRDADGCGRDDRAPGNPPVGGGEGGDMVGELLELAVAAAPETGWHRHGPLGVGARFMHGALARLLWLASHPARALVDLPAGWAQGRIAERVMIHCGNSADEMAGVLGTYLWESADGFGLWLETRLAARTHPFERAVIAEDLEVLKEFATRQKRMGKNRRQLALLQE
jgi:predicted GIY-YIG superfamily endonuclease